MPDPDRAMGDELAACVAENAFAWLIGELDYGHWRFGDEDHRPTLLEGLDLGVYPLFVDIGAERYSIEIDVSVSQVEKGGDSDWSEQSE